MAFSVSKVRRHRLRQMRSHRKDMQESMYLQKVGVVPEIRIVDACMREMPETPRFGTETCQPGDDSLSDKLYPAQQHGLVANLTLLSSMKRASVDNGMMKRGRALPHQPCSPEDMFARKDISRSAVDLLLASFQDGGKC